MRSRLPRLAPVAPLALSLALGALAARAETQAGIVAQMQAEGYRSIEVSTTWLRRVRIVAEGGAGLREVVIDPRNGEVLRDFTEPAPRRGGMAPPPGLRPGGMAPPPGLRPGEMPGADRPRPEGPGRPGGPDGGPGGPGHSGGPGPGGPAGAGPDGT
ncbi:hypothetical protein [Rhodobacter capsulatus]|uniref:hypothetical protein n=1 Tax=Rhodobacter capsulatus TaxID=1061 RepID=UPI001BB09E43|nr:hypothetical protein [Rhodobacter capsulatus]